jgi:NCAIR mutase (PurE)-related protein
LTSKLKEILERFARQEISLDAAAKEVNLLSYREVGKMAKIDPSRIDRIGIPEAILAEGKSPSDLVEIALSFLEASREVLITRVSSEQLAALRDIPLPEGASLRWEERAKAAIVSRGVPPKSSGGKVGILSAGTADIPVAEEARLTAEIMGCDTVSEYDVGVAGIHRLFPSLEKMMDRDALVVAAGREGTLPAVVAGLMEVPVVGLPVSTGYGAGGKGEAALLSMLQSCSVMVVVNIDAGFVAGAFAARIANRAAKGRNM